MNAPLTVRASASLIPELYQVDPLSFTFSLERYETIRAAVAHRVAGYPVVFWRKWGRTEGKQLVRLRRNQPYRLDDVPAAETSRRHVVLVEGPIVLQHAPAHRQSSEEDYLLFGIRRMVAAKAASVGVITPRVHFTDAYLGALRESGVDWVMVSDRLTDIRARYEEHCPGVFCELPQASARRYEPHPFPRQSLFVPKTPK